MIISDNSERYQIIWDLGRRCSYSCSYCPPHRNSKTSKYADYDDLVRTMEGIHDYAGLIQSFRKTPMKRKLSFTGGEPTVHPDFFPFLEWLAETYPEYSRGVTTNGFFKTKRTEQLKKWSTGGTISYHCEATEEMKDLVINNILELAPHGYKVNVMFHKDYFKECVMLCEMLEREKVSYVPRPIGDDDPNDTLSTMLGYTHEYDTEQQQYFKDHFGERNESLGRPCCGGRTFSMDGSSCNYVSNNNFIGFKCFVNYYFLFINSELDRVWSHQTCGVNLDGEVKPLGFASRFEDIVDRLARELYEKRLPIVTCPKTHCGCGLCIDKTDGPLEPLMNKWMDGLTPEIVHAGEHEQFLTREAFWNAEQ